MRKRPLLWFACVFLSGLAYARYKNTVLFLVLLVFIAIEIYYGANHKRIVKTAGRSVILLSAFLLGVTHMTLEEAFRERYMHELEEQSEDVLVWGKIKEIKHTDYGVRMRLSDCYVHLSEATVPCNDIMVYASVSQFHVGEIHKIKGKLKLFEAARNQGNFDYKVFYQSQKIDFAVSLYESSLLGNEASKVETGILLFKKRLLEVYETCMDESAKGFFSGLILGEKDDLEEEIKELFALGGISHMLAISGLHVSMLGRNCYQGLRKCGVGFTLAGGLATVFLLLYGCMVGESMSAVRAIGMLLVFFLGQCLGRSYDMLNALGAMLIVLLWENPFLLEYSGFWFSVMALMGVGYLGQKMPVSVAVSLTTLPVVASCYYEIPLYSPVVNAITLPFLAPIFLMAVLGGMVGLWMPLLARVLLMPCSWGLGFYIWVCEIVERLPFASIICGAPTPWVIAIYYLVLFIGGDILHKYNVDKTQKKRFCLCRCVQDYRKLGIVLGVSVLCIGMLVYPKEKELEISFLDVGQGDAIYISTGDGAVYFIDGGSTSEEKVGEYRILPFLKSKGIACIDYWFVSHADMDHISGLIEILEAGYRINYLVVSKYAPMDEVLDELLLTAKKNNVAILKMQEMDCVRTAQTRLRCLYPWNAEEEDKNETSLVLQFEVLDDKNLYKAFFAGDISSETERKLWKNGVLSDVNLYKVSHHGSKYSNSKELLDEIAPECAVISCSSNNVYGHPHEDTLQRLKEINCQIMQTKDSGQITIKKTSHTPISFVTITP